MPYYPPIIDALIQQFPPLVGQKNHLLDLAVKSENQDMVEYLLKKGACTNFIALHHATACKNLPIATLLVKFGADVNAPDTKNKTT